MNAQVNRFAGDWITLHLFATLFWLVERHQSAFRLPVFYMYCLPPLAIVRFLIQCEKGAHVSLSKA